VVFEPGLHKYELIPAGAHHCVEPPVHIELFPVMLQSGVITSRVFVHVAVQPPLVVVNVYVPAAETLMQEVVLPPGLHRYEFCPEGPHHCVELPEHTELLPVMVQLGLPTDSVLEHVLEQPPLVVVTE
jgi:hypothetical protein